MEFLNNFLEHYSTISINVFVYVVLAGRMGVRGTLINSTVGRNVMNLFPTKPGMAQWVFMTGRGCLLSLWCQTSRNFCHRRDHVFVSAGEEKLWILSRLKTDWIWTGETSWMRETNSSSNIFVIQPKLTYQMPFIWSYMEIKGNPQS